MLKQCALGAALAISLLSPGQAQGVPPEIQSIFDKPLYHGATWGLRVVQRNGQVPIDLRPTHHFYIGSVRKVFTVGQLLGQVGADKTYDTPVYRTGSVDSGVLHGNLVLVASGDLTMGGRTLPDGKVAYTGFDHNEANSLGNAILTAPDPLAGYKSLARQVRDAGVTSVEGDVLVDDRLFEPFDFRGEFQVVPIFVNDDAVDLTIEPAAPGAQASLAVRPLSAALQVTNRLTTGASGSSLAVDFDEAPKKSPVSVSGTVPADLEPPLTHKLPLVRMIRIVEPSNYARTVFIQALQEEGITVTAPAVAENDTDKLPASYSPASRVALLKGNPYGEYAKFILKVSYNIGADTSLVLYGLTQGVRTKPDALRVEETNLATRYGIPGEWYHFIDGSGGGDTWATPVAVTTMLQALRKSPIFPTFHEALPALGVDGSLGFVTDFQKDPSLRGATGQVRAKPGTLATADDAGQLTVGGQAFAGYIHTRQGHDLVYEVVVNNVPVEGIEGLMQIFQDQGTVSAILWRDY